MRRVVITGMGIVSSIGNNTQEVLASLREARSGIARDASYAEHGFRVDPRACVLVGLCGECQKGGDERGADGTEERDRGL